MISRLLSLSFVLIICLASATIAEADTLNISFAFGGFPEFDKVYVVPAGQHVVSIQVAGSYGVSYDDSPIGPPHTGSLSLEGLQLFQTPALSFHGTDHAVGDFSVTIFDPQGFDDGIASFSLAAWNFLLYRGSGTLLINTQEPLTSVPEPSTLVLFLTGVGSMFSGALRIYKRRLHTN